MNPPSMSLNEIQTVLGVSRNKVKSLMKNNGVHHDGTPEMKYPWTDANNAIEKFIELTQREKSRRAQISERRNGKKLSVEEFSPAPEGKTRREAAEALGIDAYHVKDAVRNGILHTNSDGFIPEEVLKNTTGEEVLQKLFALKNYTDETAAQALGMTVEEFHDLTKDEGITPSEDGNWLGEVVFDLAEGTPLSVKTEPTQPVFDAKSRVTVRLPERKGVLDYVGFHLGPTNSGKTYKALENLCEEFEANPQGRYVYSGPLRMLAYEVYVKMVARYGEASVGFITGEESVNPEAPIIAATVEMTPLSGDLVVVDEAHWILDPERGHYWTKLLATGDYRRMHVIAAQEAAEGLSMLVADALESHTEVFKRRTGISYDGTTHVGKVPEKTAVVCFSRNDVYTVYERLLTNGRNACVLYGALPVEVRKKQIQDYENGLHDIVVTTNVIGHGINLPIDNVVFAGTERFDGERMIELPLWEAGQISGRAGRFGLSEKGRVTVLEGMEDLNPEPTIVRGGVNVAAGRLESGLEVERPFISPKFEDLGLESHENEHLLEALDEWSRQVMENTAFLPAPLNIARKNIKIIASQLNAQMNAPDCFRGRTAWRMDAKTLWTLASGPFDPRSEVVPTAAEWLNERDPHNSHEVRRAFTMMVHADKTMELDALEASFKAVSEFKMLGVAFANDDMLGTLPVSAVLAMEQRLVDNIQWKLDNYALRFKKNTSATEGNTNGTI